MVSLLLRSILAATFEGSGDGDGDGIVDSLDGSLVVAAVGAVDEASTKSGTKLAGDRLMLAVFWVALVWFGLCRTSTDTVGRYDRMFTEGDAVANDVK